MAYESKYAIDRSIVFREAFNSEQDVRRNRGIPNNVSYQMKLLFNYIHQQNKIIDNE